MLLVETPAPDVIDQVIELGEPPLERAQQCISGTREAALKNAHCEMGGGPIQDAGAVVVVADVVGGPVVKLCSPISP